MQKDRLPPADMLSHDVWSLGCMMVWLLTDVYAFDFGGPESETDHPSSDQVKQTEKEQKLWVRSNSGCCVWVDAAEIFKLIRQHQNASQ